MGGLYKYNLLQCNCHTKEPIDSICSTPVLQRWRIFEFCVMKSSTLCHEVVISKKKTLYVCMYFTRITF